MSLLHALLLVIAAARLLELTIARRNTRRLLAEGAIQAGQGHYPAHRRAACCLVPSLLLFRSGGQDAAMALACVLPAAAAATHLGDRKPGAVLDDTGRVAAECARWCATDPSGTVRHPNYLIVELELIALPLAFGAPLLALVIGLANALLIGWRIRIEDRLLAPRRQ